MVRRTEIDRLFKEKAYLNLAGVAKKLKLNRSLLAQYANGIKTPSPKRLREIEEGLQAIGKELLNIKIAQKGDFQKKKFTDLL